MMKSYYSVIVAEKPGFAPCTKARSTRRTPEGLGQTPAVARNARKQPARSGPRQRRHRRVQISAERADKAAGVLSLLSQASHRLLQGLTSITVATPGNSVAKLQVTGAST